LGKIITLWYKFAGKMLLLTPKAGNAAQEAEWEFAARERRNYILG